MIKVSVIIPVFNCEKYLKQCIKSVLNQTIQELEVICVDDGSTDSSVHILESFIKEDARIILLLQENQGAGVARNLGMKAAQGEYIIFLDADDYYFENDALECMYNACKSFGVLTCASRCIRRIKQDKSVEVMQVFPKEAVKKILDYRVYQSDYFYQVYMFQRKMLIENQIFFPTYRRFQDPPFFVKAAYAADKFVVVDKCLYCYRLPDVRTRFNTQKTVDLLKGIIDNLRFAQQHEFDLLFHNTVEHLEYEYTAIIYESVSPDDLEILKLLMQANQMICDTYKQPDYIIKPLRRILFSVTHYERKLLSEIERKEKLALYGAGKVTKAFLYYLKSKNMSERVSCIVVSDLSTNESNIDGIPVISLQEFLKGDRCFLFVTVGKRMADEIVENLKQNNYMDYEVMDDIFGDILLQINSK